MVAHENGSPEPLAGKGTWRRETMRQVKAVSEASVRKTWSSSGNMIVCIFN